MGLLTDTGSSWSLTWQTPNITASWTSFGEDSNGELYAVGGNTVYKITDPNLNVTEEQLERFKLFPNPSNNKITIHFNAHLATVQSLSIINSIGQQVKKISTLSTENITIATKTYAAGLYFVEITDNTGVKYIKKFIVN
ncbi:T9SS type A sorting domain-containing protein [Lacinutrix neustonica]|uniref:T9SS type A sorting domain-containing protein n=1 Tax=Lacinutrix neustonica TaxID=2980107 RepID=A0A9E8MVB2_9FLAO|nr:T9SS type A sorting domain-containing protein [Lacinutrix neustonica]WAC02036.1 T9SS type A sorting domain-containing protein [Lacinutrix neustonica]